MACGLVVVSAVCYIRCSCYLLNKILVPHFIYSLATRDKGDMILEWSRVTLLLSAAHSRLLSVGVFDIFSSLSFTQRTMALTQQYSHHG